MILLSALCEDGDSELWRLIDCHLTYVQLKEISSGLITLPKIGDYFFTLNFYLVT